MSVLSREGAERRVSHENFRSKALLQAAVTEAFALINAGKQQEAIAEIAPYFDLASHSSAGSYVFGLVHFNCGELRDALSWFDRALALQEDFPEALSARAVTLQRLGQPEDALQSFSDLARLKPHDPEPLFSRGVVLQSLGRMNDALAAYEEALRRDAGHREALTNRGALLERFGRLDEALACFDAISAINPSDSINLFNRGSVLQKLGRYRDALASYEEAGRCGPPDADNELNRGNVLQRLGRLEEAIAAYDLALHYRPLYPQALYNKGIALQALGKPQEAISAYDGALALNPSYYEASCNRGNALYELGRYEEALAACAHALNVRPGFAPALTNRAIILLQLGRVHEALASCEEALRRDAAQARCLGIRGAVLHKLGFLDDALASLEKAVALDPAIPESWLNRGNVLQDLNRHPEAIASYHEALSLKPHYPEALSGLGVAYKEAGEIDKALACFDEALEHKPNYADARNNRAGALLLMGRLREGFADYESRFDRSNAPPKAVISDLPLFTGQDVRGRKILVWDEQGLGDLIQFSRYLLTLAEAGAEVTFFCRKNMHRLLSGLPKPIRFIEAFDRNEIFSYQVALMSLPFAFRTCLETLPAPVPYLRPEHALVARWADRIGTQGFRIGVAWQGNKFINLQRSIPLPSFAPLARLKDARLISLMKDQDPLEIEAPAGRFKIESLGHDFDAGSDSFVDCAAAMANLDLIVTSDTSIAHLAGALGRPVFVALKKVPDWRWLLGRSDCPWYPSMRLFRQNEKGEWAPVFEEIAAQAQSCAAAKSSATVQMPVPQHALSIPGSAGELIDKITILEIKETRIEDAAQLANIRNELALLRQLRADCAFGGERLAGLESSLKLINHQLWDVENALREHEARGDFGENFVSLARQVYKTNDRRAALKREINMLFNSPIVEEKSYGKVA